MSTRNIVPRANGEGSIGTEEKHWGHGYFDDVHINTKHIYNTVADMIADTSQVEGGTALTKGYYDVDDGCGELYQITHNNNKNVDGDESIALKNGLYAVRLSSSSMPNCFLAAFFYIDTKNNVIAALFYSKDGINFSQIEKLSMPNIRDISFRYFKQHFYEVEAVNNSNSFALFKSTRMKDRKKINEYKVCEKTYPNLWAPDIFIDDDAHAYVYFAKQKGTVPRGTQSTDMLPSFDIYVSECEDITAENPIFKDAIKIELPNLTNDSRGTNYIDATVTKIGNQYVMMVKNENYSYYDESNTYHDGLNIFCFTSSSPTKDFVANDSFNSRSIKGMEGPCILCANNRTFLYCDNYMGSDLARTSYQNMHLMILNTLTDQISDLYELNSDRQLRHGTVIYITDNYAKRVIEHLSTTDYQKGCHIPYITYMPRYTEIFTPKNDAIYDFNYKYACVYISELKNTYNAKRFYIRNLALIVLGLPSENKLVRQVICFPSPSSTTNLTCIEANGNDFYLPPSYYVSCLQKHLYDLGECTQDNLCIDVYSINQHKIIYKYSLTSNYNAITHQNTQHIFSLEEDYNENAYEVADLYFDTTNQHLYLDIQFSDMILIFKKDLTMQQVFMNINAQSIETIPNSAKASRIDKRPCIKAQTAPTIIPAFVGQHYLDTTNKNLYIAMDTTDKTSWIKIK